MKIAGSSPVLVGLLFVAFSFFFKLMSVSQSVTLSVGSTVHKRWMADVLPLLLLNSPIYFLLIVKLAIHHDTC